MSLDMNFVLKSHSVPENPAYNCVINPRFLFPSEAQAHSTSTHGNRPQPHFQTAGIDAEDTSSDILLTDISP